MTRRPFHTVLFVLVAASAIVVAAPLKTTAHQIGLNWLQRRGIELDIAGDEQAASWGQMVVRGIGMLSYRSPIGLEQKFGRDWFKKPGETLEQRGMYNIESWLRHHGGLRPAFRKSAFRPCARRRVRVAGAAPSRPHGAPIPSSGPSRR